MKLDFLPIIVGLGLFVGLSYYTNHKANEAIERYEISITQLTEQIKAKEVTVREIVVPEFIDRVKEVETVKVVNTETIREVIPPQFFMSQGWVYGLNQSILGQEINPSLAQDTTPSQFTDVNVLENMNHNLSVAHENAAQLNALLEWHERMSE